MIIMKATTISEAGTMPSTQLLKAMAEFNHQLIEAGVLLSADGLQPSSKGARVVFNHTDSPDVVQGPFTPAEDLVAGYWIFKTESIEEAIEWVKKVPQVDMPKGHTIEVRRIFEAEDFGDALPVMDDAGKE
jgi:hypothetical protein